jgi:hypothetical protein
MLVRRASPTAHEGKSFRFDVELAQLPSRLGISRINQVARQIFAWGPLAHYTRDMTGRYQPFNVITPEGRLGA